MNDMRLTDLNQIEAFLQGSKKLSIELSTIDEKYQFIQQIIKRLNYSQQNRKGKRLIYLYLKKFTGYKKAQLYELISRALQGKLERTVYHRNKSFCLFHPSDIKLLEETDELHLRLNRYATSEILRREVVIFHHHNYDTISQASPSHIDNLRKTDSYISHWVNSTKSRNVAIGLTQAPEANGKPGSIRIDSVSQRDVYHINSVDEVTQWEIVICVPQISERYLEPALESLLKQYPFIVFNFHSDRGSEFINQVVAKLLNKLLIKQTKSRSRHCNDNALVESKNGSILRKNMGYTHINQGMADKVNEFYTNYFNIYLNYHRPCGYVTEIKLDKKGRERKIYGEYTTPYEKLKEVSKNLNQNFLKPGLTFEMLDKIAYQMSDNEYAKIMRDKQHELFEDNISLERQQ